MSILTSSEKAVYGTMIDGFKTEVCNRWRDIDPTEEREWYSLTIGYLLGRGLTNMEVIRKIAIYIRYEEKYWLPSYISFERNSNE